MGKELKISYDKEADVLYVSLGHPEYTLYTEIGPDLILRLDPETHEVVGFTIIDFAQHFAYNEPSSLQIPLTATFSPLRPVEELKTA